VPRKKPLSSADRAIARRLTQLREDWGLSREDLALSSTLAAGLITRVELGRMPFRYKDALHWLPAFQESDFWAELSPINPLWIAEDARPVQLDWPLLLPFPNSIGIDPNISFSQFVAMFHGPLLALCKSPPEPELPEAWLASYLRHLGTLAFKASQFQSRFALIETVFITSAQRLAPMSNAATQVLGEYQQSIGVRESEKRLLTTVSGNANLPHLKSPLAQLLERLNQATVAKGRKAELAKHLKAPRPCVSDWLSGKRKPSGETTLRLLQWVEQQERQQMEGPGSVTAPPGPQTQSKASNEKKPKSSPPKE